MGDFVTRRRVEFADTDMEGIVHFARFFVFLETAEHELLRSLGHDVHARDADGTRTTWPRVEATCRYASPARFGDELEIRLRAARVGRTSVTYEAEIRCESRLIAEGRTTAVRCRVTEEGLRPVELPEGLRAALG
jgi:YbgC/YbaW family acyl-CoA thioester hydrolase